MKNQLIDHYYYCVKNVQIWSFFWSVFSCIWTEYRKMQTRKNSVFGHFSLLYAGHFSLLYAVNSYLKEFCTEEFHCIELDSGWTWNNHLITELFPNDNLHLNRKGYEKLSKLIIGKTESFQITIRHQNSKVSRNYSEAVSFSIVDDQFPPLLSVYQIFSKPVCPVNVCKPLPHINPNKHICSFNFSKPIQPVNS